MTMPAPDISSTEIIGYLASRGWERDEDWRGASVWHLARTARILVPLVREYEDDEALLSEAVGQIAKAENRPLRDVLLDISDPDVDVQYFRTHPDAPPGITPLPSGLKALQGIHDLLKTGAITTEKGPELIFEGRGRNSPFVDAFLGRVMLTAAVPGSYVLTTRIPTGDVTPPRLDGTTSGRSVVTGLQRATRAAHEAASEALAEGITSFGDPAADDGLLWSFSQRVEHGVSANTCRALASLGGQDRNRPFEVGFSWARGSRERDEAEPVTFTGRMPEVLWQAAKGLERLAKSGQARMTGRVEDLRRRPNEMPRAKIVGELEMRRGTTLPRRTLWVVLNSEQNEQAIAAYRNGWILEVQGRLTTTSQHRLEMLVDSFQVIRRDQ